MKVVVLEFGSHAGFWLDRTLIVGGNAEEGVDPELTKSIARNVAHELGVSYEELQVEDYPDDWDWCEMEQYLPSSA